MNALDALLAGTIVAVVAIGGALTVAGVKIVHAITPGPICPACLDGAHGELAEINEGLFRCDCECHQGRAK